MVVKILPNLDIFLKSQWTGLNRSPLSCEGLLNLIFVSGSVCNFLGLVLPQQKLEATDRPVLQLHVTVQFYLENKGKYILEGGSTQKTEGKPRPSSFYVFFLLPLSLPYVNWASLEGCLFYLRSSLLCSIFGAFPFVF